MLLAAPPLLFPDHLPLAAVAALAALAIVWTLPVISRKLSVLPATPLNLALIVLCLALMISIVVSADPDQTLPKATGLILGLAVWHLLAAQAKTARQVSFATALFVIAGLAFAVFGLFSLQELPKIPVLAALNPAELLALSLPAELATHPNLLAGTICLLLPLPVAIALAQGRPWAWRVLAGLSALVLTAILVLTQSRGGWVGAIAGLVVLAVTWSLIASPSRARTAGRIALAGFGAVLIAGAIWIGPERVQQLWLDPPRETAIGTLATLNYRRQLWPVALEAVADFPLTGAGLGAFREVAFRLYPLTLLSQQDIGHAHNIFLQTALDMGLPGLVAYIALLLIAAATAWQTARRSLALRPIALGLLAGLAALHVFGLADAVALGAKPGVLFWWALGLITAMQLVAAQHGPRTLVEVETAGSSGATALPHSAP